MERVAKLARWLVEQRVVTVTPAKAGASSSPDSPEIDSRLRGNDEEVAQLADQAERAARLAKADLVTGMVGEFPELQGIIGGYLAERQGEPKAVAAAIRDHYKPVGQGDEVPIAPVTVAVALADKLDTLVAFFGGGMQPTGSKDPFALRRAALGVIQLAVENGIRLRLLPLYRMALRDHVQRYVYSAMKAQADADVDALRRVQTSGHLVTSPEYTARFLERPEIKVFVDGFGGGDGPLLNFFADRLKVQQREAGVRHDLIDAVFALGGEDDLVRLLARVQALQSFVETEDGTNLLAGYKRAANILKKENWSLPRVMAGQGEQGMPQTGEEDPLVMVDEEPELARAIAEMAQGSGGKDAPAEERALVAALDEAEPRAQAAIDAEDFRAAMAALASLRQPIDAFFDKVTVNDPEPSIRARRLNLLARFRDAVHRVADFSRIEG